MTYADVVVHLLHARFIHAPVHAAGLTDHGHVFGRQHRGDVHARRVVPDEEGLVGLLWVVAVEIVDDLGGDLFVHGLRPLQGQRTLVLAGLVRFRAIGGVAPDDRPRRRQAKARSRIHRAGNLSEAFDRSVLARRSDSLVGRSPVDVGEAHSLHRIQVIQVAPEFLEAMRRRQRLRVISQVVLAELAGVIAEVVQKLRERRGAGPQVRWAAG